jgi:hypothetical protein
MSVMTVSGSAGTAAASGAAATKSTTAAAATKAARGRQSSRPPPAISKGAGMMKQLKDLQTTDAEALKKVAADVADKLKAEAQKQSGDDAQRLSQLADKFAQVAKTGDLSALKPTRQSGGTPGTAPATGAAAYSENAQKGAIGVDVKQIVADAVKAATKATA